MKIYASGTVRCNKRGLPDVIKFATKNEMRRAQIIAQMQTPTWLLQYGMITDQ